LLLGSIPNRHRHQIWPSAYPTLDFYARDAQYKLAYSVGTGVAYRVAQNTSIDVGYQDLSAPDLEYMDFSTLTTKKGVDYHQVKVGLRYDLW